MKNFLIISGLAIAGIVVFVVIAYIGFVLALNFWPTDRVLAKDLSVSGDWTEIKIDPELVATYRDQSINLRIPEIDERSGFDGIKRTDGALLHPESEVIDTSGNVHLLHLSGYGTKFYTDTEFRGALHKSQKLVKVRIRSDVPFTCSEIYWRDYDPK
jgi:hypothetical protein